MTKYLINFFTIWVIFFSVSRFCFGSLPNFNIVTLDNPAPGYILSGPYNSSIIAFYDNSGHYPYYQNLSTYGSNYTSLRVLDNGNIACFSTDKLQWVILDHSFNMVKILRVPSQYRTNWHSIQYTPSGNYLLIGDITKVVNMQNIIPNGNTKANIDDEVILEMTPQDSVVFSWDCLDHIDITDATDDIDLTAGTIDPYHMNSVVYDTDGNLLVSFRDLDEIIKISRTTGTIIWIMGGSKSRKNQFTFNNDTQDGFTGFSHQHDPKRIANGDILLFDDGNLKPTHFSRAVEYQINEIQKTATKVWDFRHNPDIPAEFMGNAQRLPNGNTMIGWGFNGNVNYETVATEVTSDGKTVFEFTVPNYFGYYQVLRNTIIEDELLMNISSGGNYNFNDAANTTGVSLEINNIAGSGYVSVEKHNYGSYNVSFAIPQACPYLPLRWVINNKGITSIGGRIYLDLSTLNNVYPKTNLNFFYRKQENSGTFSLLNTSYNAQYNRIEADFKGFGEYIVGYTNLLPPNIIYPINNAQQIPLTVTFKWTTNSKDETSRLQIATDKDFKNLIGDYPNINNSQFPVGDLKNLKHYYWRVMLSNGSCTSEWSDTSSFTTIVGTPTLASPAKNSKDQPLYGQTTWNTVNGADSYVIQVSEDSTFNKYGSQQYFSKDTINSYLFLKPFTCYYWRVAAIVNGLYGYWSDLWNFTTGPGQVYLNQPANQSGGLITSQMLSWISVNGINSYRLQLSADSGFTNIVLDSAKITKTSLFVNKLDYITTYYWRVKAYFKDTSTYWSSVWSFKTMPDKPIQSLPADNATNLPVNGQLYWTTNDSGVVCESQIAYDNNFKFLADDQVTRKNFINYRNLNYFTQYYWRVRESDGQYFGNWTNARTFKTIHQLIYPPNMQYKMPTSLVCSWHGIQDIQYYQFRISTDSVYKNNLRNFDKLSDTTFTVTDLSNNQLYYWSVKGVKDNNQYSSWSESYHFTTKLSTPKLIYPLPDEIRTNHDNKFKWSTCDGIDSYQIQIAFDSLFNERLVDRNDLTTTEFDYSDLLVDTTYYWKVSSLNYYNSSDWSEIRNFSIDHTLLALISPKGGEVWFKDTTKRLIQWDKRIDDSVKIELLLAGVPVMNIQDSYYDANGIYYWQIPLSIKVDSLYQIRVTSLNDPTLKSVNPNFFTITTLTNVESIFNEGNIVNVKNYPNPFGDFTYFEFSTNLPQEGSLKIYNTEGEEVATVLNDILQPGNHIVKWVAKDMTSGVYYYRFSIGTQSRTGVLTIIK